MTHLRRTAGLVGAALLLACTVPASAGRPAGDPLRARQWGLDQIHAPQAWSKTTGKGVVVAVVDQGVDGTHPDLVGQVLKGKDLVHGTDAWDDTSGHGTAVAGVIAARRDNGQGVAGVAPGVKVLPVKVGENDVYTQVPAGIRWAASHGAKVIVLPYGLVPGASAAFSAVPALTEELAAALAFAWQRGSVTVVSAGNNSEPYCGVPASLPHALCVGAVDKRGNHPSWANTDAAMASDYVVAPGGSDLRVTGLDLDELIWTTTVLGTGTQSETSQWDEEAGTSFSAPFVGGVAAMLFSRGLTNAQVVQRIKGTATDLGVPGRDPVFGYGEVDAARAVG